jgi:hypothetical protein
VSAVKLGIRTWFALNILTIAFPGFATEPHPKSQVIINVYNDAQISEDTLVQAEQEATRVFHQAGIDNVWVECKSSIPDRIHAAECESLAGPRHLGLRIVPWSSKLRDSFFGMAFLSAEGEGTYSDVFYDSVEKLHADWGVSVPGVLGHVMAHEIGHLLLGSNAHSRSGIMSPRWQGEHLRGVAMGTLLFTPEQGSAMRNRLFAAQHDSALKQ